MVRVTDSLVLLDESDTSVQQKKGADDTEIDPILKTSGEDSGGFLYQLLVNMK